MNIDLQRIVMIVLASSSFVLVLSLWIGGILLWAGRRAVKAKKVRRRLGLEAGEVGGKRVLHLWHEGRDFTTFVPAASGAGSWARKIERQFRQAEMPVTFGQIVLMALGITALTTAFVTFLADNVLLGVAASVALLIVLRMFVLMRMSRREALFELQLVDALELAARSLRAGHPLLGAFHLLADEMAPPVSLVFSEICQRHGMGDDLEQALRDAGDESASDDMRLFATSVAIQIRTGGNLADLMERLALVIRDRMRLHRRVRVLTSQTQMSKRVLVALPILMFVLLNILNRTYMQPFYQNLAGQIMLGAGVFLLAIGTWIMNRMAVLKY